MLKIDIKNKMNKMNNKDSMNKIGRPKGSKNTPRRTLDLRDYIPPTEPKFKITSTQRKLLKSFNPDGLPDFRTKEWKTLSYDEKDNYIAEQLSIAKENKKDENTYVNYRGTYKNTYYYFYPDQFIGKQDKLDEIIKEYEKKGIYEIKNIPIPEYELINKNNFKSNIITLNKTSNQDKEKKIFNYEKTLQMNYEIKIKKKDINKLIQRDIPEYLDNNSMLGEPSMTLILSGTGTNSGGVSVGGGSYSSISMRDAISFNLEDYDNQEWDTKKGRCVFDYIKYRYGNLKGLKLACNDEELIKIFDDEDALINGVNTFQIRYFCRNYNIPLYAYDENENIFLHYYPDKKSNYPSMMFKILNNHFYPIPEKKRRKLINLKVGLNINTNLYNDIKEETKEEETKEEEIITLKANESSIMKLGEMMNENQKIPLINMYNGKITSIKLNDIKYIFNDDTEEIKKIISNMSLDYKGQSLNELVSLIIKDKINKSSPNINIYNQLLEAKKNRAFNGLIENKNIDLNDDLIAYDINKCYSSILYNPIEEWILLDINNEWEDFNDNDDIKLGLYFIETDDNKLFKGNNIYSSSIVKKAIEENIKFRIVKALYADKKQSKNLFVDIIDDILKITNNDKELYKLLINCISGMMGKNKMTNTKANINKSLEQIYITLNNYKNKDIDILPFINKIDNTDYYIYGYNKDVKLYDINIPMYIQILDQSNIKLYDMIKKVDGELIGRKVDCAIFKNAKNKLEIGDKWGDYRLSYIPNMNYNEINNNIIFRDENDFRLYNNIIDSDNFEKILNICINKKGCLLTGDAGTGKSYVIHKITEILGKEKVIKITPTNKSALNIKGQTIHRFLKIDKDGKIPRKTMEKIKNTNLELIIIDEISMINKELWKLLLLLKEETKISFLLIGDEKQLPPIENDGIERDYFNSSIVKYLSNYNKINLQVKKRYDEKLSKILEDVENINIKDLGIKSETKINICYFNKTRKLINAYWNNKEKNDNSILIKANEDDEITQDIYLYSGLPLISRKTLLNGDLIINNEKFILENYDNQYLYLFTERPDENGETYKHKIDININDLQKNFCLNYCSTTHKSQGETITEKYTIYDFNFMSKKCKYTALSRAKSAEQIIIDGEIKEKAIIPKKEIKDKYLHQYYLYEYNNIIKIIDEYDYICYNYYYNLYIKQQNIQEKLIRQKIETEWKDNKIINMNEYRQNWAKIYNI